MLDIHAHLFWDSYDADRDEVIRRAREAGVEKMICVGTSPQDNPQAIAVAEKYDNIFASVGLHPHHFNEIANGTQQAVRWDEFKESAKHPKVVAIGECGLDYFSRNLESPITDEQKRIQKEGFLTQIGLAEELELPLIIHTRPSAGTMDAYEDVLEILRDEFLKDESYRLKAVLHCYQGDTEITEKFLTLPNVYFSFAGNITYPVKKALVGTKDDLMETVKRVPLERLFTETDCPFLAPQGHRGERNEPSFVVEAVDKVALLHEVTREVVEEATRANVSQVFPSAH